MGNFNLTVCTPDRAGKFILRMSSLFALGLVALVSTASNPVRDARSSDQPATITAVPRAFKMDGDATAWSALPSMPIMGTADEIGRLKLAYDADAFYAFFTVPDTSPLKNATSPNDPAMMLKGGDAVGFTFGSVGGQGAPQRILFSLLDGQPVAVVYRAVSTEKKPYTFESPVGKVTFDYVAKLQEAQVVFKIIPGGYSAEIRIPWSVLGLKPRDGMEFPFDAQIILSDEAGQKNSATGWWHSVGAGPFSFIDLPTEAQLYPDAWGKARLSSTGTPPANTVSSPAALPASNGIPIHFKLPQAARVSMNITDQQGWILRELCVATPFSAGENTVTWDGRDEYGDPLPEGNYCWKLAFFDGVGSKRIGGAGNSARPPFRTKDGKGDLGAIHGMPSALASDAEGIYHLGGTEEGNPGLTKLSPDGFALWKRSLGGGWGAGLAMAASDRLAAMVVHTKGKSLLTTMNPKTGKDATAGSAGSRFDLGDVNVTGLAICGNKACFSIFDKNQIGVLDLATGQRAPEIAVPTPRDVRAIDDTHLLVTSGNQVLKLDLATGRSAVLIPNLTEPHAVARDAAGNVYVSEWGDRQQISKFSSSGKLIGRFGPAGGRPAICIPYNPQLLYKIKSLCVGPDGNLWFMEESSLRRVGVMTTTGKWQKDIFQTLPSQGGAGVDMDDPSRVFFHMGYDSMVESARIDFAANALDPAKPDSYWKLENIYMLTLTGDYTPPAPDDVAALSTKSCILCPIAFTGINGKRYLWQEGSVASLWMESGGRMKPVTVIGGKGVEASTLFPKDKSFNWSDANGDGLPQAAEIELTATEAHEVWRWIDRDLTLYGFGGKLKPYKVDDRGVPYYRRSDWIPDITTGKPVEFYYRDRSYSIFPSPPAPDGARYDVFNSGAGQQRSFWDRATYSRIARIKDGRIQWIAGQHDGTKKTPGGATYLWRPLGEVDGTVIVGDVDFQLMAYTSDGFGLGGVTPGHSDQIRDQPPEAIVQENVQSGHFVKDPKTGKPLVIIGSGTEAFVLEVTGINPHDIHRLEGTVQLGAMPPLTPETPGHYSILYRTWPKVGNGRYYWVTGDGWGFRPEIPWLTISDGSRHVAEVRLRRDAGALHIYANIFDPHPFSSESAAVTAGDFGRIQGLEVLIGPASPEKRSTPVAGDTRFFLTAQRKGDTLTGVLLASRPANDGSDTRTMTPVPGAKVAARESLNGYGYHLEAEIPLTFLSELSADREVTYIRNYQPGAKLKGDFNETYTQRKPDLMGTVRLNVAVWQSANAGVRRIPWVQDGQNEATPQSMNPSRWGAATSPDP